MSRCSQSPIADYRPVYTDHGRLYYLPEHLRPSPEVALGLFQARSRRPQRIYIARVLPDYCDRKKSPSTTAQLFGKLADSRLNAKRFLRSFIASPNPSLPDSPVLPANTAAPTAGLERSNSSSRPGSRRRTSSDVMRTTQRHSMAGPFPGVAAQQRPSLTHSIATTDSERSMNSSSSPFILPRAIDDKPLASANGINLGISLAEPVLFLQGFEHTDSNTRSTAMLRGNLHLRIAKNTKIKKVTLRFKGRAITKWPEGIPPEKNRYEEVDSISAHTWPFFDAQFPTAERGTCADHVELFKSAPADFGPSKGRASVDAIRIFPNDSSTSLSKEEKRLSLKVNQSRSFGKGDSSTSGSSVAQKGYRTFAPGDYVYNFELPLDSHLPETIEAELGSVKYELEATVERAGAFKANLIGAKEVVLIRAPAEGSLEQVEPIAISRNWEDQLHYDIVISGKSFPLGAQVPIAFKLTPLAKVQCHRIKVFITENVEYWANNKRVHRMEPAKKLQLFEKRADGEATSTFPGSTMRILSGGGIPYDQRVDAAEGRLDRVTPLDTGNLLGPLNGGDTANIGPTEMEFNVQLPTCTNMKDKDKSQRLHFDTTYQNIQVHHWIKIVMRLSKPDAVDPNKRRHFEISIDSPFHILSCRATQANIALPAYSSPENGSHANVLHECGCPGAPIRRGSPSFLPTLNSLNNNRSSRGNNSPIQDITSPGLARPAQAHIGGPINASLQRPIHLTRAPSFNPPAFEEDQPPPPLETPPPMYETIASPTSGLADYFARLSDAYEDESDDERVRRGGRVNVPLTPGGRVHRSFDEDRSRWRVGLGR